LRNSIDHGLEKTDARIRAGKSKTGKVMLSASQEGNHIILSVKDDGKGLDIEKIKQKAIDKGLVTVEQAAAMSKQDIMQLIFLPGFSTADQVSNISGRGVGMDVVRTNIKNLSGMIDVFSEPGIGTEVVLKLPLTLAIMQALMVRVEDEIYAVPLASVIETIRIQESDIKTVHQREVITHRESVIPLLRLARLFEVRHHAAQAGENEDIESQFEYVVLVGTGEKRFGLVVNRLIGQEEVVIKSLGDYLGGVSAIAGGTITGDGRVRLIVDCANIDQLT
jgi:two-component system chemotaxis sensor kinase CheA